MKRAALITILLSVVGFALEVPEVIEVHPSKKLVVIQNEPIGTWRLDQAACVVREMEKLGCGLVKGFSRKGAYLVLAADSKDIRTGDIVYPLKNPRDVASIDQSIIAIPSDNEVPIKSVNVLAGVQLSLDNIQSPIVEIHKAVTNHIALGLQPAIIMRRPDSGNTLTGYGASLTVSYYFRSAYRGFFSQLGSGMFKYTAQDATGSDSSISPALTAVFGWRERWAAKSNIGIGIGGRYMPHLTGTVSSIKFTEAYPFAVVDIGFEL